MEFGYDGVCVCVAKKWRLVKQKIENVFAMQSVWATIFLSCSKCFHSSAMDRQAGTERTILNAKNNLFSFSSGTTTTDSGKWRGGQKMTPRIWIGSFCHKKVVKCFCCWPYLSGLRLKLLSQSSTVEYERLNRIGPIVNAFATHNIVLLGTNDYSSKKGTIKRYIML